LANNDVDAALVHEETVHVPSLADHDYVRCVTPSCEELDCEPVVKMCSVDVQTSKEKVIIYIK